MFYASYDDDDDDVPVIHDFIRFHNQYPAFLRRYSSSLKTGPARPEISHTKDNNISSNSAIDTIILPFVY